MSSTSQISWTDATWAVTSGCREVSPGCVHCYAANHARRMGANPNPKIKARYQGLTVFKGDALHWSGEVRELPDQLQVPLHWRAPRRVFVNSLSDLFHESVSFDFIDCVFGVMAACEYLGADAYQGHTFQVLTKRAGRMREYLATDRRHAWARHAIHYGGQHNPDALHDQIAYREGPLPNVWLGVSVEDQQRAMERVPHLLEIPAAVRFLSCEPMLGPVDLRSWLRPSLCRRCEIDNGDIPWSPERREDGRCADCGAEAVPGVQWVICGCESGAGRRPCNVEWVRSLVRQCAAAHVPAYVKQLSIDSHVIHDMAKFPEDLRIREFPR